MRKVLVLNPADNIAICLGDVSAGESIKQDDLTLTATQSIPRGHKICTKMLRRVKELLSMVSEWDMPPKILLSVNMFTHITC